MKLCLRQRPLLLKFPQALAVADGKVSLSPAAGKGLVYAADSGELNRSLTALTANGGVYLAEVTPGPFELTRDGVRRERRAYLEQAWYGWGES